MPNPRSKTLAAGQGISRGILAANDQHGSVNEQGCRVQQTRRRQRRRCCPCIGQRVVALNARQSGTRAQTAADQNGSITQQRCRVVVSALRQAARIHPGISCRKVTLSSGIRRVAASASQQHATVGKQGGRMPRARTTCRTSHGCPGVRSGVVSLGAVQCRTIGLAARSRTEPSGSNVAVCFAAPLSSIRPLSRRQSPEQ